MPRFFRDTTNGVVMAIAGGFILAIIAAFTTALRRTQLVEVFAAGLLVCILVLVAANFPGLLLPFGRPLKVKIIDRHAHPLNYAAEAAAMQLLIKNRTWHSVELPGGYSLTPDRRDNPPRREGLTEQEHTSLVQKLAFEEETSHHQPSLKARTVVPAHHSTALWVVTEVSHLSDGGHPEITILFRDGGGNKYTVVAKRQGRRPGQLPWWRKLWRHARAAWPTPRRRPAEWRTGPTAAHRGRAQRPDGADGPRQ